MWFEGVVVDIIDAIAERMNVKWREEPRVERVREANRKQERIFLTISENLRNSAADEAFHGRNRKLEVIPPDGSPETLHPKRGVEDYGPHQY